MWLLKPEFSSVVETDSRKMLYLDIFYICNHKTIKEENCKSLISMLDLLPRNYKLTTNILCLIQNGYNLHKKIQLNLVKFLGSV